MGNHIQEMAAWNRSLHAWAWRCLCPPLDCPARTLPGDGRSYNRVCNFSAADGGRLAKAATAKPTSNWCGDCSLGRSVFSEDGVAMTGAKCLKAHARGLLIAAKARSSTPASKISVADWPAAPARP